MTTEVASDTNTIERLSLLQDSSSVDARDRDRSVRAPRAADSRKARTGAGRTRVAEHVVFLVPGLLGFERVSTFAYFADRVVAALRASLEQILGQPVPVIAVPIPPTASLRTRQARLVKTLADRVHSLEHGYEQVQVHLVGHSTGGVDVDLLTHEQPLGGGRWSDLDSRVPALHAKLRSVISIASPHQGACIARDPTARFLRKRDLTGIAPLLGLAARFLLSAATDVEVSEFITSSGMETAKAWRLLSDVSSRWELLDDLQPSRVPPPRPRKLDVVRRSFVTIAGKPRPGDAASSPADSFFRALSERASGWSTGAAEEGDLVQASVARLRRALSSEAARDLVIKADGTELPTAIDAGHNDGVVNSARQLIDPSDPDELAGIVVADHFDVVGYYDRFLFRTDQDGEETSTMIHSGLLHSGSCFRDDQFFELYQRVANAIVNAHR